MKEERIVFRVNTEVKQIIKEKADQVHKTVSQFLRELALNYVEKIQPQQEVIYLNTPRGIPQSLSPQPQNDIDIQRIPREPSKAMVAKRKEDSLKRLIYIDLEKSLENGGNLKPISPEELKKIKNEREERLQNIRKDRILIQSNSFYEL